MRPPWLALALLPFTALASGAMADQAPETKSPKFAPAIFGTYEGNAGCVILKQERAVKKKWMATGTIVAVGEYEVVQTFHYEMTQTKFQGQKGIEELSRIGQRDRIKFVVVPGRYTAEQLNVAWDECQKNLVVQPPAPATGELPKAQSSEKAAALGVTPPEGVYEPEPAYTREAKRAGIEGTVRLLITVDEDGKASDVRVRDGPGYGLDEEAAKTVKTWKFKPALKDGKPVSVQVIVEVNFRLRRPAP